MFAGHNAFSSIHRIDVAQQRVDFAGVAHKAVGLRAVHDGKVLVLKRGAPWPDDWRSRDFAGLCKTGITDRVSACPYR